MDKLNKYFFSGPRYYFVAVFLIFSVVFLAIILGKVPGGDGHDGYLEIARSIATGHGFTINGGQITGRSPVYPYVLSAGLRLGFDYWWVWFINFGCCLFSAHLLRKALQNYRLKNAGAISILICCNPLILWLSTNSMPYALSLFLITAVIYFFLSKNYLLSAPFTLVLFFTHPSFGVISLLLIMSLVYFSEHKARAVGILILSVALIGGFNLKIKELYGDYPVFSATGAGFQYLRARNQYLTGRFQDDAIFEMVGSGITDRDLVFSVVTNDEGKSLRVDKIGKQILVEDAFDMFFFFPKFLNGLKNTLFSGILLDSMVIFVILSSMLSLFALDRHTVAGPRTDDTHALLFLSSLFFVQLMLMSIVGFKMRYSSYFLPMYPFFTILFLAVIAVTKKQEN